MTHRPAVITRFAPSPTGHLHIGGARTALFCWALAHRVRREGGDGRFLLRIEDTDQRRSSMDAVRGILEDLAWLGIAWDEGPEWREEATEPRSHGATQGGAGKTIGGDPRGVGSFFQSERHEIYARSFNELLSRQIAYPAFDSPDELAARRKTAEAEKKTFVYRQAPGYDHAAATARVAAGEPHVVRFKMPGEAIHVRDEVLGDVTFPADELDDFVIRKADGFPTYHFAVVVDDELMGVTHVLRGQEHLNNTPRHVALQRALGFRTPVYAHMPLIFNVDGTKMSKRDKDKTAKKGVKDAGLASVAALREKATKARSHGATKGDVDALASLSEGDFTTWLGDKQRQLGREQVGAVADALGLRLPEIDVEDFRAAGYLPGVLLNFLALLGWNPGMKNADGTDLERFDTDFLSQHFDIDRIGKSNAKFDRDKLLAFNAHTLQHGVDDARFAALWLEWAERFDRPLAAWARADSGRWAVAAKAARPRCKVLRDGRDVIAFALAGEPPAYDATAFDKSVAKGEPRGAEILRDLSAVLVGLPAWEATAIESAIHGFAEARGLGLGKVAPPVRVAVTGGPVSPPLGETLALLGREGTLARFAACAARAG